MERILSYPFTIDYLLIFNANLDLTQVNNRTGSLEP